MDILYGLGMLFLALAFFSLFSMKAPKGAKAMSGLANAAVVSFLVEAIHSYISGDLLGIEFLGAVGNLAGSLGGLCSATLVALSMGTNPVLALVTGVGVSEFGILPGFIAGYLVGLCAPYFEKYLPDGVDSIVGVLVIAPLARLFATLVNPGVTMVLSVIGGAITVATQQSPLLMGFILGGIMKIVCTSPLSSMALTAMLGLTGLPMGIASVACFGGAIGNGILFNRLHFGNKANAVAVILEPLTQADIITKNPLPIYTSSFISGSLCGIVAVVFNIISNAPGTASSIPGLIVPFAFNNPGTVAIAMGLAALCGLFGGYVASLIFKNYQEVK